MHGPIANRSFKIYREWERVVNGKDIVRVLKVNGWEILRQEGSYVRMGKENRRTTVPLHGARDVKIGTLSSIERQTGVKLK